MKPHMLRQTIAISILCLFLSACAATKVTHNNEVVTNPTIRNAARAIKAAEITAVEIVTFLSEGYSLGIISLEALTVYDDQVSPYVQAALDGARTALITAQVEWSDENQAELLQALQFLLQIMDGATTIARQLGYKGEAL